MCVSSWAVGDTEGRIPSSAVGVAGVAVSVEIAADPCVAVEVNDAQGEPLDDPEAPVDRVVGAVGIPSRGIALVSWPAPARLRRARRDGDRRTVEDGRVAVAGRVVVVGVGVVEASVVVVVSRACWWSQ
jgi:hypothetical protein